MCVGHVFAKHLTQVLSFISHKASFCFGNCKRQLNCFGFSFNNFVSCFSIFPDKKFEAPAWKKIHLLRTADDVRIRTTVNIQKISDTLKNCCNCPKVWTMWFKHTAMHPEDGDRMAIYVDPDQTAPGADWSGSTLFAQTCLPENLGSLG